MSIEKSEALILRVIPFRDTSKVITAYTADHGLVSLLAKGVRGAKPRFGGALELFARLDLVYYHKESRDLQLLSEATLLDPRLGLSREPVRYAYAMAVLEFLLKVLKGQEVAGRLYLLAQRTLDVLDSCPREALAAVFRAFELKTVSFLGHRPELYVCVECGREADREPGGGFSPRLGGVVCNDCTAKLYDVLNLSPSLWRLLRRLLAATLAEIEAQPPSVGDVAAAGRLVEPFLQAHLERYESLRAIRMVGSFTAEQEVVRQ
jgi:DNA repair protein RecO (recombination protein O)